MWCCGCCSFWDDCGCPCFLFFFRSLARLVALLLSSSITDAFGWFWCLYGYYGRCCSFCCFLLHNSARSCIAWSSPPPPNPSLPAPLSCYTSRQKQSGFHRAPSDSVTLPFCFHHTAAYRRRHLHASELPPWRVANERLRALRLNLNETAAKHPPK